MNRKPGNPQARLAGDAAVAGQGGVRVVMRGEGRVNDDVHDGHASCGPVTGASRFLLGLVPGFAVHDGIPAAARAASRRCCSPAGPLFTWAAYPFRPRRSVTTGTAGRTLSTSSDPGQAVAVGHQVDRGQPGP
jgi:hypothetical protein